VQIRKTPDPMSDVFETYEEDFRTLAVDVQKKLSDVLTYETNPGEEAKDGGRGVVVHCHHHYCGKEPP
jgi:hypothetical protein